MKSLLPQTKEPFEKVVNEVMSSHNDACGPYGAFDLVLFFGDDKITHTN